MFTWRRRSPSWIVLLALAVAVASVAVAACSSGSKSANSTVAPNSVKAAAGGDAKSGGAPATDVQRGNGLLTATSPQGIFPAPADPPDPKQFPTTFKPEPGGLYFYTNTSIAYNSTNNFPWVIVIDAKTHKIVAAAEITDVLTSPHGIGVSADGKQVYLPAGSVPAAVTVSGDGAKIANGVAVVDAKTLKLTQSIGTQDRPHHIQVLDDRYMEVDAWGNDQDVFLIDTQNNNAITRQISAKPFNGTPYIGFPSPDGKYIYETVRPLATSDSKESWLSRINLSDWSVEKVVGLAGGGAVWTTFSRDGKWAYVSVPEDDHVVKVDLLATPPKIVGSVGVGRGPYGVTLSSDEATLYVVSKGEGGRGQRGGTFVTVDVDTMRLLQEVPSCTAFVCQADHAVLSPDGTEFWIDNNMGYVDVFDIKTLALKAEMTMPNLGDPHGGVFVQYDSKGNGHVVMDPGGPRGGVSPYPFDNKNGVPTLADALKGANGWAPAAKYSALQLGAKLGSGSAAPLTGPATVINVVMKDFFFDPIPATTTVPAGGIVTFHITNAGQAIHNLTSDNTTRIAAGLRLEIKQQDVGINKTLDVTFKAPVKPGTYKFTCVYHPNMDGLLVVK